MEHTSHELDSPSARACLDSITVEVGVGKRKVFSVGAQEFWKYRLLFVAFRVVVNVSVHEAIH